ncbi:MAG: hypothetical protein OHK0039_47770 [Bacteroidia bacterium]
MAGSALLAGAAPDLLLPAQEVRLLAARPQAQTQVAPSDRVGLAVVGCGIMGFNNVQTALKVPGVELVAACDLYDGHLTRMKEVFGQQLFTTRAYEELLARSDVDAVIVATSDHWHDRITIDALKAGKAVYCEKPMVHRIEEGRGVIEAEKRYGKVVQVGSQRVSSILVEQAQKLYRAGDIGQLVVVEAWIDRQSALGAWQYSIPTDASPETVDWARYQGDAPARAYDPLRFFRWRNYQDYGTGMAGDLFVHLLSGLHVITGSHGPSRVFASGGLRYWNDGRDVPDVLLAVYDYPATPRHPAFNVQMRVNFIDGAGGGSMTRLIGTEGTMTLGWDSITVRRSKIDPDPGYGGWDSYFTFAKSEQKAFEAWYKQKYPAPRPQMRAPAQLEYKAPEGYDDHYDHWHNFITAIRTGGKVVEDATFGFRAAAAALAVNLSYHENRPIQWDPEAMRLV